MLNVSPSRNSNVRSNGSWFILYTLFQSRYQGQPSMQSVDGWKKTAAHILLRNFMVNIERSRFHPEVFSKDRRVLIFLENLEWYISIQCKISKITRIKNSGLIVKQQHLFSIFFYNKALSSH